MSIASPELLALVGGTLVLLILALGIIGVIILQQRKLFAVQQKNLETLGEREQRYRRLVKYSPFPLAVFIEGRIVYVNDAGARLLGVLSPEDLINKPLVDFVHESFYEQMRTKLRNILQVRKDLAEMEDKLVRRDGQVIDVEITAIPIIYDGQDAIQIVVRDITERKRQQTELITAKERAEQSDKLKDAFIANISHEIRTPLNVVLGYSTLVVSELSDRIHPEEAAYFDSIERGGQRLMRTVEHILNISSIQVGTFQLRPEHLDMNARVEKLVQDLHSFAEEKGVTLRTIHESEAEIHADRYCIDQALTNLVDNAIKFTQEGEVTVRVFRQDQRVCIEVKDTGIGISAEYLPKVFNVFSQEVTGYTRPFEGLGLGLALTKRYVDMNNGSVTVKSRKGQGSTFTLRFLAADPVTPLSDQDVVNRERAARRKPDAPLREGIKTILVVEDDEQTQDYMRVLLSHDYNIKTASTGIEAWEALNGTCIDLILMDLSLRGNEDGLQLTERIRRHEPHAGIPIFAVTAHAFPEDRERSLQAGCDLYFSKPFQIEELKTSLKQYLGSGSS